MKKNKALKQLITELLEEEFRSLLLKLLVMEELTRNIKVAEEEIMAMDEDIKESAWRELKKRWKL